jgi:hypothetical protein
MAGAFFQSAGQLGNQFPSAAQQSPAMLSNPPKSVTCPGRGKVQSSPDRLICSPHLSVSPFLLSLLSCELILQVVREASFHRSVQA